MIAQALDQNYKLNKHSKFFFSFECIYQNINFIILHGCGSLVDYQFINQDVKDDKFLTDNVTIRYSVESQQLLKVIKKYQKEIQESEILIGTDNDRAGELIGWTIVELIQKVINKKQGLAVNIQQLPSCRRQFNTCIKPLNTIAARDIKQYVLVQRLRLNSLFKQTILKQIENPQPFNNNAIDAEDLRSEIDLRIGYTFCGFQRKNKRYFLQEEDKENYKLPFTFGTCQIPTLGICQYENEDLNKQKIEQYKLQVQTQEIKKPLISDMKYETQQLLFSKALLSKKILYVDISKSTRSQYPPNPLNTVKLQQHFNNYSAYQVLKAAETLYTNGYITYPRTETEKFNNVDVFEIIEQIKNFQSCPKQIQYLNNIYKQEGYKEQIKQQVKRVNNNSKLQDDQSHTFLYVLKDLNKQDKLSQCCIDVYNYILTYFIATISENSITDTIMWKASKLTNSIDQDLAQTEQYLIKAGWQQPLYGLQDQQIPDYYEKQQIQTKIIQIQLKQVQRQKKVFQQSDLISYMDKYRIGTDATIASHIETVEKRNYIDKKFKPTERGFSLTQFYSQINFNFVSPTFRAMMEQLLKRVELGYTTRQNVKELLISDAQKLYNQCQEKINK